MVQLLWLGKVFLSLFYIRPSPKARKHSLFPNLWKMFSKFSSSLPTIMEAAFSAAELTNVDFVGLTRILDFLVDYLKLSGEATLLFGALAMIVNVLPGIKSFTFCAL